MSGWSPNAIDHLRSSDLKLRRIIELVGPCTFQRRGGTFAVLAKSVLSQQISTHAARTIRRRLEALMTSRRISAAGIAALTDDQFQQVGVSQQKRRYLRDLAEHTLSGKIRFRSLARLPDETVIDQLVQVKGIGRWTAQMFLLGGLGRPDVFAPDDLGLQNAARNIYELPDRPTIDEFTAIAEPWRPYRSIASWYLWSSLDTPDL